MCGLVGVLFARQRAAEELRGIVDRMAGTLAHRGPDDSGTWADADQRTAFGFRRLAVLDLSAAGHQPMTSASGRFIVVLNGEIYNHPALRRELEDGTRFRGHSDTETLLAGFDRWGIGDTVARLAGMFAIAVWDRERSELSLIRDRLGKKPLYVYRQSGVLAFASELRAFRQLPGFSASIDPDALAAYLRYLYVPAPASIFREIRKLRPGHILTIRDPASADIEGTPYWSAERAATEGKATPWRGSEQEAIEVLDSLLQDAVSQRLRSDVPVGALLSGGVDSSLVVSHMSQCATGSVRTYAVSFPESGFDEAAYSTAVARQFATTHTTLELSRADVLAVVPELPEIFDEPHADPSGLPTYLICALARRDVTVALTGDGGDELFGGYNRYSRGAPLIRAAGWLPFAIRRHAFTGTDGAMRKDLAHRLGGGGDQRAERSRDWRVRRVLQEQTVSGMYEQMITTCSSVAELLPTSGTSRQAAAGLLDDERLPIAERMMLFDQQVYLPGDLLSKLDRASMAASLEARSPLLDHRIAEFSWRLPLRMKIRSGQGKWILRQLLQRRLPRNLFDRPKSGFSPPIGAWLHGPLRSWAEGYLASAGREDDLLDDAAVQRVWQEFQAGAADAAPLVWALAIYRAWSDRWMRTDQLTA